VSFFDDASTGGSPVDVEAMFDSSALDSLWECVGRGAMVSIGTSRDGGALSVGVTCSGKLKREWFRESDALKDWMARAANAVGELAQGPDPQKVRKRA
jgi:hypothetical protein